jgi:two-component system, OmpR family, response regulator
MRNLVLFAHPEPAKLEELTDKLEGRGYRCLTARSGDEALAAVAQYAPQLVIAHADLPELQGTEVCLRLKQDPSTETIAVLLIAKEGAEERFVSNEVGADGYITEPFAAEELCTRVSDMFHALQLNARTLYKKS